jgi:protein-arginine kinase activator protein McsA
MFETGVVACAKCAKSNIQLFVVRDNKGKKTNKYICINCKPINGEISKLSTEDKKNLSSMLLGGKNA